MGRLRPARIRSDPGERTDGYHRGMWHDRMESERLILRPPTLADAPAIFAAYASDPEVTRYLTFRTHASAAETRAYLKGCLRDRRAGRKFVWLLEEAGDGGLLGGISLRVQGSEATLGYVVARAFWGRGYAPEAVRRILDATFSEQGIDRVSAICDVENPRSVRVLEKAGLRREGVLRGHILHPNLSGEMRDVFRYSISRSSRRGRASS